MTVEELATALLTAVKSGKAKGTDVVYFGRHDEALIGEVPVRVVLKVDTSQASAGFVILR